MLNLSRLKVIRLLLFPLMFVVQSASANINAIDFSLVGYPSVLQSRIDFLKQNESLFNHWAPEWKESIPKSDVINDLNRIYDGLNQISNKNTETYLLLGDVAHYLYNLNMEDYWDKAVDNYKKARALSPDDYRCYWFLANHYSLSAEPLLAYQTYRLTLKYLPAHPNFLFWTEYSSACELAGMLGTANYAAHQLSVAQGATSEAEHRTSNFVKHTYIQPPADTTLQQRDVWAFAGRNNENIIVNNALVGMQLQVDSSWHIQVGGYEKRITYATIAPQEATTKEGKKVGYTFLVLVKAPAEGETLQQFLDALTAKSNGKQNTTTGLNKRFGGLAYEMRDAAVYPDCGGSHGYAIAIERDVPAYPGMKIEMPMQMTRDKDGQVHYFTMSKQYSRLNTKLYYFILFDSCEKIHDESTAVFNNFLNNIIIE